MVWQQVIQRFKNKNKRTTDRKRRRRLMMESLTKRELLASDFAAITGTVFDDINSNGTQDAGEIGIAGANISLTGPLNLTAVTDANGEYRFDDLTAGTYEVAQVLPPPTGFSVPGTTLNPQTVFIAATPPAPANGTQASGISVLTIDDFSGASQNVEAVSTGTNPNSSSIVDGSGTVVGGTRDIFVNVTSATGSAEVDANPIANPGFLELNPSGTGAATYLLTWDGDSDPLNLDATGLGGQDFTVDGTGTAIQALLGFDIDPTSTANGTFSIAVFSDAANFTTYEFELPDTGSIPSAEVLIRFDGAATLTNGTSVTNAIVTNTGTGVDFESVGALQLAVDTDDEAAVDGIVDFLQVLGPAEVEIDFPNESVLALGGIVFEDNNGGVAQNNGLLDAGELGIAGVTVQLFGNGNLDPATDTPIATTTTLADGTYNFPDLDAGDYLTFIPNAQFATGQPLFGFTNSTGNDPAPDPDDDVDGDDNGTLIAGVGVSTGVITLASNAEPINDDDTNPNTNTTLDFGFFPEVDLVITKTLNEAESDVQSGGDAVFDIVVQNLGPSDATTVVVTDVIPSGLTFDAGSSSFGAFTQSLVGNELTINLGDLAVGETATFQIGTTIATNQATDIVNEASVEAFEFETNLDNNNDDAAVDLTFADLVITKTDAIDPIGAGAQETYTITVINNGPDTATDVTITDNLPEDVTFVSGTFTIGNGTIDEVPAGSGDLIISVGDIPSGATVQIDVVADVADTADSPLNNIASVIANPNNDPNLANNDTNEETVVIREVDLTIDKSVDDTTPTAGETVTYTLVASNIGPGVARDVQVTDVLNPELTFVPGSFDPLTSGVTINQTGQNLSFDVGVLGVGETRTFTFDVTVDPGATGVVPNEAEILTSDIETNPANNIDDADITVQNEVDLVLTKAVDLATAVAGQDQLVYTFTINHDTVSPSDAQNVVLTDVLPAGLTGVTINAPTATQTNFDNATGTVTVEFDTIPVGETRTFTVTADIDEAVTGTLTNTASIAVDNETDLSDNNDTAVTIVNPEFDVTITKDVNNPTPLPGETVTYDVVLVNSGPSTATGVVLTDDIPAGLSFVSGTLNGLAATVVGNTVTFPAITLGDDQSADASLVFTVSDTASGVITNTADVTTDPGETNLLNNDDQAVITVTPQVDISVVKTVDNASSLPGGNLVYTVTVTNSGPSTAVNVIATDTLPAGVTFVSGTGPNGAALTAVNGVVTVNGGNLADNASFTFTVNGTINQGVTTDQVNTVSVATDTAETNLANNTASAVTTVDPVTSSIAGTVFVDANNNGVQDIGEVGIAGVEIALSGVNSLGVQVNATATTNANGDYIFTNLAAGTYTINEIQPVGFSDGTDTVGQNAPALLGNDVFMNLELEANTDATAFDFGELAESLSKRRFLASSTNSDR